jgi:hypothetical protein
MSYSYKLETQKQPTPSDEGARYEKQDKVPKRNYETRFHKSGSGARRPQAASREIVRERFRKQKPKKIFKKISQVINISIDTIFCYYANHGLA